MREIKFRGRDDALIWHYGDLVTMTVGRPLIIDSVIADNDIGVPITVAPATVGQFTGLKDSEGHEIFEGDIIQVVTKNPYWGFKKNFAVEWNLDGFCLNDKPLYYWFNLHDLKVIGNVHDNPELLEATHD